MSTILVAFGDTHCGSTLGLCPPAVELDDGGVYRASRVQRWTLAKWEEAWGQVWAAADTLDAPVWVVANGDLVDGDHHNTYQIFSKSPDTQMSVAISLLEPIVQKAQEFFVVRGTPSHVGQAGWAEERIAADLDATPHPSGASSWYHLLLECNGVRFEFQHHYGGGSLPWTQANAANQLAARTIMSYAESGDRCPHIVCRSHKHVFRDSGSNYKTCRAIGLPAWQLVTEYGGRFAQSAIADIGLVMFVCDRGDVDVIPLLYKPRRARAWKRSQSKT